MAYQYLSVAKDGPTAVVSLNRPQKANALNYGLLSEIEDVALSFRDDFETLAVVFTGAGKNFCAGLDLTDPSIEYGGTFNQRRRANRIGGRAMRALHEMDQITICAWNGAAMGGGAVITTALDFRIGGDDCRMGYPEVDLGANLSWGGVPLLTHLVGPARAKRLIVGNENLAASTLLEWGVLDKLVAQVDLMNEAMDFAGHYASKPPVAAQMIKQSVNRMVCALDQSVMHMDADQNLLTLEAGEAMQTLRGQRTR